MTLSLVHKNAFSITFQVSMTDDNPWLVTNLDKFLFYNCPQCDVKKQDKEEFLLHALRYHSKARQVYKVSDENVQCYYCCSMVPKKEITEHTKKVHRENALTHFGLKLPHQCSNCHGAMETMDAKTNGHVCHTFPIKKIADSDTVPKKRPAGKDSIASPPKKVPIIEVGAPNLPAEATSIPSSTLAVPITLAPRSDSTPFPIRQAFMNQQDRLTKLMEENSKDKEERTCKLCQRVLSSKHALKLHVKDKVCIEVQRFSSEVASVQVVQPSASEETNFLYEKKFSTQLPFSAKHLCTLCPTPTPFQAQNAYTSHLKQVHCISNTCQHCGKSFKRFIHLESHIKRVHLKLSNVKCKFCTSTFASEYLLKKHEYYIHATFNLNSGDNPAAVCNLCPEPLPFVSVSALKRHLRENHGQDQTEEETSSAIVPQTSESDGTLQSKTSVDEEESIILLSD